MAVGPVVYSSKSAEAMAGWLQINEAITTCYYSKAALFF